MNNLNSILIEGNLTRDPELKYTPSGTPVLTFSIGVNRAYKKEGQDYAKESSFFDIETWGKLAESCAEYLSKGRGVRVVGRLKQDRWLNEAGDNRSKIKIVAEHVEFKPVIRKPVEDMSESQDSTPSETDQEPAEVVA